MSAVTAEYAADDVHRILLEQAGTIAENLREQIQAVGPVTFRDRPDYGLDHFLSRAIVGQQLSTKAARSIWARVETAATESGSKIPEFFCAKSFDIVRACGVSGNKFRALQCVREANATGMLDCEMLGQLPHHERSEILKTIWGIGQWTCDMASISYFQDPNVWPETDVTVQNTFSRLIGRRKPTKAAQIFSPYRSYLALTMWKIADAPP